MCALKSARQSTRASVLSVFVDRDHAVAKTRRRELRPHHPKNSHGTTTTTMLFW